MCSARWWWRSRRSDGTIGFAVTTGGEPAAFIVEKHLARFLEGARSTEIEKIWDQMYFSTQYYGRKGLVINAISGVDLALWDLLGKLREEPVHQLLGGAVRDELHVLCHRRAARPGQGDGLHRRQDAAASRPGRRRGGLNKNLAELADHARNASAPISG